MVKFPIWQKSDRFWIFPPKLQVLSNGFGPKGRGEAEREREVQHWPVPFSLSVSPPLSLSLFFCFCFSFCTSLVLCVCTFCTAQRSAAQCQVCAQSEWRSAIHCTFQFWLHLNLNLKLKFPPITCTHTESFLDPTFEPLDPLFRYKKTSNFRNFIILGLQYQLVTMSINLYNPASTSTDLVLYQPPAAMTSCPVCPVCPPPTHGPSIPQGVLESLFLLVGMVFQYALARFRLWSKGRRLGASTSSVNKDKEDNFYEEAKYQPGPSAPPPPVCQQPLPTPPSPPTNHGGLVINVGNPFTNPFVNGPHQG